MTRFVKLVVVGVLSGTLGLIGCSSDGGTGGTGGGTGGTGGSDGPPVCGTGVSIDPTWASDTGGATCDGLGVIQVPIEVVLAANADGAVEGETDVDVQVSLNLSEATVGELGSLVQQATIGEASADVNSVDPGTAVTAAATTPCQIDFSSGAAIEVPTTIETGMWTATDGSVVVEVVDITFAITAPAPLNLSTAGDNPACTWDTKPTVTVVESTGGGGAGGDGGAGGNGGDGG